MAADYAYFLNLAQEAQPPTDGILSRTIYRDEAVLFGFAAGQELSEHTAAKPALAYFVQGEAVVGLGGAIAKKPPPALHARGLDAQHRS